MASYKSAVVTEGLVWIRINLINNVFQLTRYFDAHRELVRTASLLAHFSNVNVKLEGTP